MMKYIVVILFIFAIISVKAQGQLPANTIPTQFSTGLFKHGWDISDSGRVYAIRDTSFRPRYLGTTIYWPHAGVDTAQWIWNGLKFVKNLTTISATATTWGSITGTLSSQTDLQNALNLKLNISDTTNKWLNNLRRRSGTDTVEYFKNGSWQFAYKDSISSGGTGTVTSVGLSMPSAFTVTGTNPITTSGTFNVTGAGTSSDYIKGNGTLGVTDTSMIPNFSAKVRGLFSGASPITFNSVTGVIGSLRSNSTGQLGVATFNNTDFTDNGLGLISLRNPPGPPGVDTIYRTPGIDSFYYKINGNIHAILDSTGGGGGSGTVTQVNTGYGLSGGPITTTGTILVDTNTLKNVFLPLNVNSSKVINQAGNEVYFTGGGQLKADSINYSSVATFATPTALLGVGDSYIAGFRPCTPDTIFFDRLTDIWNLSPLNYGVSSTGIWRADSVHNFRVNPGHTDLSFVWAGFNDIRRGGINNDTTYRKIIWGLKSIISNHFLKSYIAGGATSGSLTRYGSWTTTYTCAAVGGKSSNNGGYTNTINDSLVYNFIDSTVVLSMIGGDGHTAGYDMGSFQIFIDGVSQGTFNGLVADGISDGFNDNARSPFTFIFTGLSLGAHSLKVVNTQSHYVVVDYVGHLKDKTLSTPLLISHAPYNNLAGFAVSPNKGSVAAMLKLNNQIDSMLAVTAIGWPIYTLKTNNCLDTLTGICTDNIHPNNTGDIQITSCATTALPFVSTGISNGTLIFDGSHFQGRANNISHVIPWLDETLQLADSSRFILAQTAYEQAAGFRIGSASILHNKLTVGSSALADGSDQLDIVSGSDQHMRLLGFSGQNYLQSINAANTTGVPFNFGAGAINFGSISGGITTNYATFDNSASNKLTVTGNALVNSTVRVGSSLSALDAPVTIGTIVSLPYLSFYRSASSTDQKIWDKIIANDSTYVFRTVNDAFETPDSIYYVTRSGIAPIRFIIPKATLNIGTLNMQGNGMGAYFNRMIGANKDSITLQSSNSSRQMLVIDTATGKFQRMSIPSGGGATIYSGDGTLAGDRTVTGSANNLIFTGINLYKVFSNYLYQAKSDGSWAYASAIDPGATGRQSWQFGYLPFLRGVGLYVDTLNNVGLGDATQTNMPLYTTGNSAFVRNGFQSQQGNFYAVSTLTSGSTTLNLAYNFILLDATSGNVTVTLPAASAAFGGSMGLDLIFKRIDNSVNTVTIQRAGSDLIDGASSFTLGSQWESKSLRAISTSTWGLY